MKIADLEYWETISEDKLVNGGSTYAYANATTFAGYNVGYADANSTAYGSYSLTNTKTSVNVWNDSFATITDSSAKASAFAQEGNSTSWATYNSYSFSLYA